ncbi:GFA family protein [Sphingomonas yunnanensis]|nr:GFA family protein [Sphingomonas yunnanensis]
MAGGCHCGAIRYEAEGAPEHHAVCHRTDCRGWSGAPETFQSSEHGERQFCGTGLFYRNADALPGLVDVQSGTLDDPAAHAPGAQIMVKERLPWTAAMSDLPAFATFPGVD